MQLDTIIENLIQADENLCSLRVEQKKNIKSIQVILNKIKEELEKFKVKKLVFGFYAGRFFFIN